MKSKNHSLVGVIMGSKSDWAGTMEHCSNTLKEFGIKLIIRINRSSKLIPISR